MKTRNRVRGWIKRLLEKSAGLKKEITALYYAYLHPDLSVLPKIVIMTAVGYAMSPVDLIPDFIPLLGYLDDIIIIPLLITLSLKLIPQKIMESARERAEKEPVSLKKNWFFGVLVILIWAVVLMLVAAAVIRMVEKQS